MWLMTKHGFYSIVDRGNDQFHVRARELQDLVNLKTVLPEVQIHETTEADYHYRMVVCKEDVLVIMLFLGNGIDYGNFKGEIDQTPDQKNKPYHGVWHVMANALGAYGCSGN